MDSQVVNIAIFGLSLRLLHEMKGVLESVIPDDMYVKWTNITDPALDWLLINDVFFDAPNIQRLLQNKKIKLLKLTKDSIQPEDELLNFSLEDMDKQKLRHWVINNIYDMKVVDYKIEEKKYETLSEDLVQTDVDIRKLLNQIVNPMNGRIKLFDRDGEIALCDLNSQWLWSEHTYKTTDQSLNFTHSTVVEILNQNWPKHHFKFWLWNLIWNSPELVVMPPEQGHLKLNIWPQPQLGSNHRDVFKMSACFSQGSTIQEVVDRLSLPSGMVQHFVAACLATDFIQYVDHSTAHDMVGIEKVEIEDNSLVRKFFSGLRRRLGL